MASGIRSDPVHLLTIPQRAINHNLQQAMAKVATAERAPGSGQCGVDSIPEALAKLRPRPADRYSLKTIIKRLF